ncbi:MAG: glycosyltransferase family 4 protein [Aeromicrobium sp.]|nr:glycosyltransferase family 4 protein [Burkholderiales bacterium]
MNILFVHNSYQHFGGEDAVVDMEIALLRSHGHAVQLYQRHNDELHALPAATAAASALWSRRSAREVGAVCADFQPDLVHVHNTFPLISPSIYWTTARKRIPVVQTLHNFRLLCPQGTFLRKGTVCEDCLGKSPWRAVARKCYRDSLPQSAVLAGMLSTHRLAGTYQNRITRYIALSAFSRDRFIAGGLPAQRLRIKPNFVDGGDLPGPAQREGGLFVGRLSSEKGIDTLLGALREGGDTRIEAIGAGPAEAEVASQLGEGYLGFRSRAEIMQRMRSASFLIVPSMCLEQLPTTILEAYACGTPVIASRLGALANIVQDGVTGLLFTPGDESDLSRKIAWAGAHGEQMLRMGRAARAEYEAKYTPSINYQMLIEIYEESIAEVQGKRHLAPGSFGARHVG